MMSFTIPYQDPIDHGPLTAEPSGFRNPRNGWLYPLRDGIPVFLTSGAIEGPNARYQNLYDRFAPFYDLATSLYARWKSGADRVRRNIYLQDLELRDGDLFLEVSVGTGANWPYLNPKLEFYGLDLSAGMLTRCRSHARRLKLNFQLCQSLAEHLPFPDSSFDSVFHAGGINFFTDPGAALAEMVRVARPGSRIVVCDETEALAKRYENKFMGSAFFKNRPRTIVAPAGILPPGMAEVAVREICDGELYVLTFRKPAY
jgi:ubiquinone/menaquinone biosynthesis C-methylase UbiE